MRQLRVEDIGFLCTLSQAAWSATFSKVKLMAQWCDFVQSLCTAKEGGYTLAQVRSACSQSSTTKLMFALTSWKCESCPLFRSVSYTCLRAAMLSRLVCFTTTMVVQAIWGGERCSTLLQTSKRCLLAESTVARLLLFYVVSCCRHTVPGLCACASLPALFTRTGQAQQQALEP